MGFDKLGSRRAITSMTNLQFVNVAPVPVRPCGQEAIVELFDGLVKFNQTCPGLSRSVNELDIVTSIDAAQASALVQ